MDRLQDCYIEWGQSYLGCKFQKDKTIGMQKLPLGAFLFLPGIYCCGRPATPGTGFALGGCKCIVSVSESS